MFKDSDKKLNRLTMKNVLFIITFTIALIWVLLHMNDVVDGFFSIVAMCKPFIYGIMIAFVFNLPLKFFMRKLPSSLGKSKKIVAALLSVGVIILIFTFIFWIVVPQVVESITALAEQLPGYVQSAGKMLDDIIKNRDIPEDIIKQIDTITKNIGSTIATVIKTGLPQLLNVATGFASSVANIFMALVIAVYLTVSKNKLISQCKRCIYAFTNEKTNTYLLRVGTLVNKTFSSFIAGQLVEAIIIGLLCYVGCLILKFPYAPILAVIIGCTNIIPIFGAIFGVAICALLVAFVNPVQGVFFVIFGICLQQFESNLIYPRVVGSSVGLSGLWVLFAITVGGGLFGFAGMLLGLPTFSVIYCLLRDEVNRRVKLKKEKEKNAKLVEVSEG
ncbi:AI-2E family transporter [Amedibacillus sp. YH-ame10]